MITFAPTPILAADIVGGIIAVIFVVISIVGWITNLINSQNHPPRRPGGPGGAGGQGPRPVRDRKIQSEIDSFLQEVGSKRRGGNRAGGNEPMLSADDVEVVEPQRRRSPPRPVSSQRERGKRVSSRPKPGERPSRKPTVEGDLGTGVRPPLSSPLSEHVGGPTEKNPPHAVDPLAASHFAPFAAADSRSMGLMGMAQTTVGPARRPPITGLGAELRNMESVRKAILINEILSSPLSLRGRREARSTRHGGD